MKVPYAMVGAAGRMGRAIIALAADLLAADLKLEADSLQLVGALERENSPNLGQDAGLLAAVGNLGVEVTSNWEAALANASVVIDFSSPDSSLATVGYCRGAKKACLVGTTGFRPEQKEKLVAAAEEIPLLVASNTSIGVNFLFAMAKFAAQALTADNFDVEIVEMHHHFKKDAPSGTALSLKEILENSAGRSPQAVSFGRQGNSLFRPTGEIGIHAARGGDVIGEHTVFFLGNGERVELSHRATSRNAFASGAIRAALFLAGKLKEPALYTMNDVLQLGI